MHGLAGDAAAEKLGQEVMLPRDIIDCLSDAFRILNRCKYLIFFPYNIHLSFKARSKWTKTEITVFIGID